MVVANVDDDIATANNKNQQKLNNLMDKQNKERYDYYVDNPK